MDTDITTTTDIPRITAEQFTRWSMEQPEGEHYELYDGVVVRVPNEGSLHGLTKTYVACRIANAVEQAALPCSVFAGGMQVKIAPTTVFDPDVVVRCGGRMGAYETLLLDPLIAVEVVSAWSMWVDRERKRDGYLLLPTLNHYLVVDPDHERIIHYRRLADGSFARTVCGDEPITLDPPGITIDRLFP